MEDCFNTPVVILGHYGHSGHFGDYQVIPKLLRRVTQPEKWSSGGMEKYNIIE